MREPLSIEDLFDLPVGGQFIVDWAKDDDRVNGYRCQFQVQTISETDGEIIHSEDHSYEWSKENACDGLSGNEIDTSRGIACFFEVTHVD